MVTEANGLGNAMRGSAVPGAWPFHRGVAGSSRRERRQPKRSTMVSIPLQRVESGPNRPAIEVVLERPLAASGPLASIALIDA